jgi:hypothetical protein
VDADGRIVFMNAFIAFPLCPLAPLLAIAREETTDERVRGMSRRVKVKGDLDPDIARTRNFGVWWFGGVKFEPSEFKFLGILGRRPGTVRTSLGERCKDGSALYG